MRAKIGVLIVLLATGIVAGQDKKATKPEGAYLLVGMEMKGERISADLLARASEASRTFAFNGNTLTVVKNKREQAATVTLDTTKSPAEITIVGKDAAGNDQTTYGIYKLEGTSLVICGIESSDPKDRPKEFKTGKDSKTVLLILKQK